MRTIQFKQNLSAIFILSIIFLWSIQFFIDDIGIPYYIVISIPIVLYLKINKTSVLSFTLLLLILLLIFFIQILQQITVSSFFKSILSTIMLSVLIIICLRMLDFCKKSIFIKFAKYFLYLQFLIMVYQTISPHLGGVEYSTHYKHLLLPINRVSGLFSEPSIVAIGLSPFIYLSFFHYKETVIMVGKRFFLLLYIILLLCPSTTLFGVFVILITLFIYSNLTINKIYKILLYITPLILLMIFSLEYFDAINDRVQSIYSLLILNSSKIASFNPSSLLFIKGGEMAFNGLIFHPLGVGIMNFEYLVNLSEVSYINDIYFEKNIKDGTSIFFKMVGEYGLFGLLVCVSAITIVLVNIRKDKFINLNILFLFGFMCSFIRSNSYFDGIQLLGLTVLFKLIKNRLHSIIKTSKIIIAH